MKQDYTIWKEEQRRILTTLRERLVWVLFSGGKDSSLLLHFLQAAGEEFGFGFEVHAGMFPKHRYTDSDTKRIDAFWAQRGIKIQWHEVDISDDRLETSDEPCLLCQQSRKQLLHEHMTRLEDVTNLVIVAAYTLWDLVSYSLEYLLGAIYADSTAKNGERHHKRFIETGQRFYPFLQMDAGYTMYRPVLRYNRQDIVRIIQEASIPILSTPCNHTRFRPKNQLGSYYDSMGLHFDYNRVVRFATECLGLISANKYSSMTMEEFVTCIF
jgi:tRNA(Ile)-lysidine synthase TilS/MesJ